MAERTKLRHLPSRLAAGGFILNSGFSKLQADEETTKQLHAMASNAYPRLEQLDAKTFVKVLAGAELALGGALLLPVIPSRMAGLGLAAFSSGLLGLYMRTPGLRQEGSIRPSQDGIGMAKDVWMLGIALSLVLDSRMTKGRAQKKDKARAEQD